MAYTPINWQTGDTITAAKLNKMDRGWGYETAELFSETVTTAGSGTYEAQLAYSQPIDADTITVTFDGTEYTCPRIDVSGYPYYGGAGEQELVFTVYPFCLGTFSGVNIIYTETAGTHTIAVTAPTIQASSDFLKALGSERFIVSASWNDAMGGYALDKTPAEMFAAKQAGYTCYAQGGMNGEIVVDYILGGYSVSFESTIQVESSRTPPRLILTSYTWDSNKSVFVEEFFNYTLTPES